MTPTTQIKIFQHENAADVNSTCNTWLIDNKSKLKGAKIEFHFSGELSSSASYPCSVMLVISNLNSASKEWNWGSDFDLDTCIP